MKTILNLVFLTVRQAGGKRNALLMQLMAISLFAIGQNPTDSLSGGSGFVENRGQLLDTDRNPRPDILYFTSAGGTDLFFMKDKVSYVWSRIDTNPNTTDTLYRMDMEFLGTNTDVQTSGQDNSQGYINYYLGHIPDGITNVPTYQTLTYKNVWNNIDMVFHNNSDGLAFDFIINPGGKPEDIKWKYNGASSVNVTADGGLDVETPMGKVQQAKPQGKGGEFEGKPVEVKFVVVDNTTLIQILNTEPNAPSIIVVVPVPLCPPPCPVEMIGPKNRLATFFGGSGEDRIMGVTTDVNGNVYITGGTASSATGSSPFPITTNAIYKILKGAYDAFCAKLDKNNSRIWCTYYGSSDDENNAVSLSRDRNCVSVDALGNVYFVGRTDLPLDGHTDFPTQNYPGTNDYFQGPNAHSFEGHHGGLWDAFIVRLKSDGTRDYATFYGGVFEGSISDITIDPDGNIWMVGTTSSVNGASGVDPDLLFPIKTLTGSARNQTENAGPPDIFIIKLGPNLEWKWSTFFGGYSDDVGYALAFLNGGIYITGSTDGYVLDPYPRFPLQQQSGNSYLDDTYGGGNTDAFISAFYKDGTFLWSTYYGGSGNDIGTGITVDKNRKVAYIIGHTSSKNLDIFSRSGAFMKALNPDAPTTDLFLLMIDDIYLYPKWGTFYGGSANEDMSGGISIDDGGNIFISGRTKSTDFPTLKGARRTYYQKSNNGSSDAFLLQFDVSGVRKWATYYGGSGDDAGISIDAKLNTNDNPNVYMIGNTTSSDFPTQKYDGANYFDNTYNGGQDIFIVNFLPGKMFEEDRKSQIIDSISNELVINVYPNPNSGFLIINISSPNEQDIKVTLFDLLGKKVRYYVLNNNTEQQINLSGIPKGMYFMRIEVGNKIITKKVIIQ